MKTIKAIVCITICSFCLSLFAQEDTAKFVAPLTVVKASKVSSVSLSSKLVSNDSNIQKSFVQVTLADAIRQNNTVHLKSYGTGLQTVSFRGTGAEHTAVYWEGIPVNSATNGTVDFSHLPAFFFNNVSMNYGDGGAGMGSGAVGGSVLTNSDLSFLKGDKVLLQLQGGSFANYSGGLGYVWSNGKLVNTTKLFLQSAKNNYLFNNPYKTGNPEERVKNNGLSQWGFLQQLGYKLNKGSLQLSTMFLESTSELANIARPIANETQEDKSLRTSLKWNRYFKKRWSLKADVGHTYEYLRYQNPGIENSEYRVQGILGRLGIKKRTKLTEWNVLLLSQLQYAEAANFTSNPNRKEYSATVSYQRTFWKKLFSKTSIKNSVFYKAFIPMNFGQLFIYKITDKWSMNASVNSIYRLPTFNDLYWQNSGNPDLKPERGWKEDLGLVFSGNLLEIEVTGFHMVVDDWLIWLPNGTTWEPKNIRKVRSMGLEFAAKKTWIWNQYVFALKGTASYTQATNMEVEPGSESALNKQLIYVPKHKSSLVFNLKKGPWFSTSYYSYTGVSYSSSDNSQELEAYGIYSSSIGRDIKWKKMLSNIAISVENILDKRYQAIAGRPVPGRTYWIKMNYKI